MLKKIFLLFTAIFYSLLFGCRKPSALNLDQAPFASCFITNYPDQVSLFVAKPSPVFQYIKEVDSNIKATLMYDFQTKNFTYKQDNNKSFFIIDANNFELKSNITYSLKINDATFPEMSAYVTLPYLSVKNQQFSYTNANNVIDKLSFQFEDKVNRNKYYKVVITKPHIHPVNHVDTVYQGFKTEYIKCDTLGNANYTLANFAMPKYFTGLQSIPGLELDYKLFILNEETYNFIVSQNENSISGFSFGDGTPVQLYNNFKTGEGFFGYMLEIKK